MRVYDYIIDGMEICEDMDGGDDQSSIVITLQ